MALFSRLFVPETYTTDTRMSRRSGVCGVWKAQVKSEGREGKGQRVGTWGGNLGGGEGLEPKSGGGGLLGTTNTDELDQTATSERKGKKASRRRLLASQPYPWRL